MRLVNTIASLGTHPWFATMIGALSLIARGKESLEYFEHFDFEDVVVIGVDEHFEKKSKRVYVFDKEKRVKRNLLV